MQNGFNTCLILITPTTTSFAPSIIPGKSVSFFAFTTWNYILLLWEFRTKWYTGAHLFSHGIYGPAKLIENRSDYSPTKLWRIAFYYLFSHFSLSLFSVKLFLEYPKFYFPSLWIRFPDRSVLCLLVTHREINKTNTPIYIDKKSIFLHSTSKESKNPFLALNLHKSF